MAKSVFYGCSAWVGRIDSETRCGFWSANPIELNFDPFLLVPVDLSKTPAMARLGRIDWDQIQIDDVWDGNPNGVTTIGPGFPDGQTTGLVYLERSYWARLRGDIRPAFPPPGTSAKEYEYTTIVYKDGPRAGRRYHGFHAKVTGERDPKAQLSLRSCSDQLWSEPVTLDLRSTDVDAHTLDGGMTEIGLGAGRAKEGALYIDIEKARELGFELGKVPLACGDAPPLRRAPRRGAGGGRKLAAGRKAVRRRRTDRTG